MKTLWTLLSIVAAVGAVLGTAAFRWSRQSRDVSDRLHARAPGVVAGVSLADLADLPPPVQRYFRLVLREGQPRIQAVQLRQEGQFLTRPESNGWAPFTATHEIVPGAPGFQWDARIRMVPGIAVRVRDAFVGGAGSMYGAVLGVVPVVNMRDTPDIAAAALQRYLAEAVWAPTALLPAAGVTWIAVDDSTARASLTAGRVTATLDFHFGGDGLVASVSTEARGRAVGHAIVPTPWQGRWFQWVERAGMLVPVVGEVEWLLPSGAQPYWRGRVTHYAARFDAAGERYALNGGEGSRSPRSVP